MTLTCTEFQAFKYFIEIGEKIELWHDKTNKLSVCPAKAQISLGIHPGWSVSSRPHEETLGP